MSSNYRSILNLQASSFENTKSIALDGVDDFVAISGSSGLSFTGDFSLSAWIKTDAIGSDQFIIDTSTSASFGNGYSFRVRTDGKIRFWSYNASQTGLNSATALSINTWYHIACVHTSTQNKIYINGTLDATLNWTTGHAASNTTNLRIGESQVLGGEFNGNIDEVAMFNSELLASDVTSIYGSGVPTSLASYSPLSWYRCGDGDTSPTLTDNGSGGNNGTMTNFSTFSTDVPVELFSRKSIALDGVDDFVNIGTTSLGITTAISVSAWVKIPTSNTGGASPNIQVIIAEDTTSSGQRNWNLFWRGTGSNHFAWVIHHTNLSISSVVTTGVTPNDGNWHHLLGTFDGTTNANGIKLYLDGVLSVQGTAGSTGINSFSSSEPAIGAVTGGSQWRFEGNIDEVAVWNSDQSANASSIYNSGVPNDIASLSPLSWWRCGDGDTAPTLTDNGSGGNNGTMTNFSTFSTDVPT